MESYKIENLSFAYPNRQANALENINITIKKGEFVTICGKSGCGKTTLLRLLKPPIAPFGTLDGDILFEGKPLCECSLREQASRIGFVMQNPDNQIVTDKVWHELAFGLEGLGLSTPEIRARVAEMASFFGIQAWFHKKTSELSGGQKQLLSLAAVMVMQPSVLILDEPTSQLDPIAAGELLDAVEKINRELGTTVIISEHRLEDVLPISDRVIVLDNGSLITADTPKMVGEYLKRTEHDMYLALPTPMKVYGELDGKGEYPLTVREGKDWLARFCDEHTPRPELIENCTSQLNSETVVEVKDAYFRYEKNLPDVVCGLNMSVKKGELFAIVGGNGTGKTTALSLISGLNTPYRGNILINGQPISKIKNFYGKILTVLPQNPQSLFVKKTVYLDLCEALSDTDLSDDERRTELEHTASLCRIEQLLDAHPYDLSGGEQQRAALAKVLLQKPEILLLDEPTKGMDAHFKAEFADILSDLKADGITIVMVSHDIEFCAEFADTCAMFFDGGITSIGAPREFFAGKSFYTTQANRMARAQLPNAVLADDIIIACGGVAQRRKKERSAPALPRGAVLNSTQKQIAKRRLSVPKIICGVIFALLFAVTMLISAGYISAPQIGTEAFQIISIIEAAGALFCLIPSKKLDSAYINAPDKSLTRRTIAASVLILLAIPFTIYAGIHFFGDRKYYFISLLIIFETMLPFFAIFEGRKPQARELVVISVLCAIAVAGRTAFFMLPQFKPVAAIVIISGVCMGGEVGFLVGAVTGFVSNFFFGQGPWTPWQMFAFGIIGFIAGVMFNKRLKRTKILLCIFGFLSVLIIYGGIMNFSTVAQTQTAFTPELIFASVLSGLPFDLIHALSTAFFLWFISEAIIDKLERIKVKYGLIQK